MKTKNHTTIILSLILATLVVLYPHKKEPFVDVVNRAMPAVVSIGVDVSYQVPGSTVTKHGAVTGAGAYISPNGHILTCAHLFSFKYGKVEVTQADQLSFPAEVLFVDKYRDLALLKVLKKSPVFLKLGNYKDLKIGQEVIAIGSPLGFSFSVSHGIISALDRYELTLTNMVQSDVAINPGNSGGPLLNMKGELIGVNTMIVSEAHQFCGLSFAQSIKEIRSFLARWKGLKE